MWRRIEIKQAKEETIQSYLGFLSYGNSYKIQQEVRKIL
jgi:hypothetical protein